MYTINTYPHFLGADFVRDDDSPSLTEPIELPGDKSNTFTGEAWTTCTFFASVRELEFTQWEEYVAKTLSDNFLADDWDPTTPESQQEEFDRERAQDYDKYFERAGMFWDVINGEFEQDEQRQNVLEVNTYQEYKQIDIQVDTKVSDVSDTRGTAGYTFLGPSHFDINLVTDNVGETNYSYTRQKLGYDQTRLGATITQALESEVLDVSAEDDTSAGGSGAEGVEFNIHGTEQDGTFGALSDSGLLYFYIKFDILSGLKQVFGSNTPGSPPLMVAGFWSDPSSILDWIYEQVLETIPVIGFEARIQTHWMPIALFEYIFGYSKEATKEVVWGIGYEDNWQMTPTNLWPFLPRIPPGDGVSDWDDLPPDGLTEPKYHDALVHIKNPKLGNQRLSKSEQQFRFLPHKTQTSIVKKLNKQRLREWSAREWRDNSGKCFKPAKKQRIGRKHRERLSLHKTLSIVPQARNVTTHRFKHGGGAVKKVVNVKSVRDSTINRMFRSPRVLAKQTRPTNPYYAKLMEAMRIGKMHRDKSMKIIDDDDMTRAQKLLLLVGYDRMQKIRRDAATKELIHDWISDDCPDPAPPSPVPAEEEDEEAQAHSPPVPTVTIRSRALPSPLVRPAETS
jgi:hypothetical protein